MEKPSLNILLSSAGRRGALLRDFRRAGRELGLPLQILVTDMTSESVAYRMADIAETAPRVTETGYTDWLFDVCKRHNIRLVFPLIDPELPILSHERARFQTIGTQLVLSGPGRWRSQTISMTEQFFQRIGLHTPRLTMEDVVCG